MSYTRCHKCKHCGRLYRADCRNRRHQKYCNRPACRRQSKKESQRRWLKKPDHRNYFCGPEQVQRVQAWQKDHPECRKRKKPALQDVCLSEGVDNKASTSGLNRDTPPKPPALQDYCSSQDPLIVGFIAKFTGALQEDIATQLFQFQTLGQIILGMGPGMKAQKESG